MTAAHRAYPAGSASCHRLMPAAETAGLASGRWRPSPDPALARRAGPGCRGSPHARPARIPDRPCAARDFTVTTRHQRVMAERSPDIAIVVPELMTNALRHAPPGSGDTRPRQAELASVNDPSPSVRRTDIGHWPVTSSTGHVWITIWCRYGRDRLPDLPAGHQATRICAGKWPTGRPGADPGTPPGVAPPSWVLAQFIHKLVHSPLHS